MADLASLMKVAPISGGMMIGQSHDSELATADMERQRLAALVQELQTKQQFDQQANPLRIQEMGLKNRGLEAGLPGIVADASLKGSQAAKAAGTLQTDITAGNALNEGKVVEEKSKLVNRLTNDLMNFSVQVDQVPAPLRAATLKQMMTSAGYKMDSPMAQQLFQQFTADPDNMSKNMMALSEKIGKAAAQRSPAYHQRIDEQVLQGAQKLKEIGAQGAQQRSLEQMRIDAGKYAKKQQSTDLESVIQTQLNATRGDPLKTWNILTQAAGHFSQIGDAAKAQYYQNQADLAMPAAQAQLARVNPNQANPESFGIDKNPPPNIRTPLPVAGPIPPQQPAMGQTSSGVKFKIIPN